LLALYLSLFVENAVREEESVSFLFLFPGVQAGFLTRRSGRHCNQQSAPGQASRWPIVGAVCLFASFTLGSRSSVSDKISRWRPVTGLKDATKGKEARRLDAVLAGLPKLCVSL